MSDYPQQLLNDIERALMNQQHAKLRGREINCSSPLREDRNPSFYYNVDKHVYNDYGDSSDQGSGNAYELARLLGFYVDAYYRGDRPALRIVPRPATVPQQPQDGPPAAQWQRQVANVAQAAQNALWADSDMLRYLHDERLLTDETITRAGLGYNAGWHDMPDGGKVAPGITIPYAQPDGGTWALRVRTFDSKLSKYMNASGSRVSGTLYGAQSLQAGKPVLLVEGEFDCLLAQQDAGDTLAVVTLGPASNRLAAKWRKALEAAPVIYLALDNDKAGQGAADKLTEALAGLNVRRVSYPDGVKDYTDYRKAGGQLDILLAPARAWWPDGMPDVWRAELRRYYGAAAELAADTINRAVCAGALDPDNFTAGQVVEAARLLGNNPTRTLERGLVELLASDLMSVLGIEDTQVLSMPKVDFKSVTNSKPAHRPAKHYRCNPLQRAITCLLAQAAPAIYQQMHPADGDTATAAQWTPAMLAALDLSHEAADDINAALAPVWAAQGGTRHTWAAERAAGALVELRRKLAHDRAITAPAAGIVAAGTVGRAAAQLRAQVEAGASGRSYAQLAADLGISRQSVPAVLRRAGVVQVEQTAARAVTQADDLPRQAKVFAGAVRGKVLNILIETGAGQVEKISYAGAASIETVREHLAAGHTVKLEARCASAQQLGALPAAAPKVARAPRTAPRRAAQDGQRRQDAPKPAPKRSPAPGYNPAWILGQLMLQARLAGLLRGGQVIDRATGELVPIAGAPGWRLLESITGLKLHNSTTYHLPAPAGWRKVDIQTGGRNERQIAG